MWDGVGPEEQRREDGRLRRAGWTKDVWPAWGGGKETGQRQQEFGVCEKNFKRPEDQTARLEKEKEQYSTREKKTDHCDFRKIPRGKEKTEQRNSLVVQAAS
jgi:hypothetical protein